MCALVQWLVLTKLIGEFSNQFKAAASIDPSVARAALRTDTSAIPNCAELYTTASSSHYRVFKTYRVVIYKTTIICTAPFTFRDARRETPLDCPLLA